MPTQTPLTVFVAMPYTNLGPAAKIDRPSDVEEFYRLMGQELSTAVQREVRIEVEKDRGEAGSVHESMFKAVHEAEVFIADLTGANANVFFELGVRYGVRKTVTILTTQDPTTPFDLLTMRVIRYGNRLPHHAIKEIVTCIQNGLKDPQRPDSPVLSMLKLEVIPRDRWERVSGIRVKTLLDKANATSDLPTRLRHVQQAVQDDPYSVDARVQLAKTLRLHQDYGSALHAAEEGLQHFATSADLHRERGLILDRMSEHGPNRLEDAIAAYQTAVELQPQDPDLQCCLGGALRRQGLRSDESVRQRCFQAAYDAYERALRLQRHSSYAGLNVLRLMLLMGAAPPKQRNDYIERMFHLCAFEVKDAEILEEAQSWWKQFDLGDTLVFRRCGEQARDTYAKAIKSVPEESRPETLLSPRRTWHELLEAGALDPELRRGAEDLVNLLDAQAATKPASA